MSRIIALSILALTLTACTNLMAGPAVTPIPSPTSVPISTPIPEVTLTPQDSTIPILPMPSGIPLSEWNGIPVMPGALNGSGDNEGYSFTIQIPPEEVQKFYENEMTNLGWETLAGGQGTTGAIQLLFMKDPDAVSVLITTQPNGLTYVLFVK